MSLVLLPGRSREVVLVTVHVDLWRSRFLLQPSFTECRMLVNVEVSRPSPHLGAKPPAAYPALTKGI